MTTGSFNFSSGTTEHYGSWSGEDDLPAKAKVNNFAKSIVFRALPNAPVWNSNNETWYVTAPTQIYDNWTAALDNALELNLMNKVAAAIKGHSFNLGVSLGEARESIDTISRAARGIAELLLSPRAVWRETMKLTQDPGKAYERAFDVWMSLRYGWRPMLSDAYNAGEAVGFILAPKTSHMRVSVTGTAPITVAGGLTGFGRWQSPGSSRHRIAFHFDILEDQSLAHAMGLQDPEVILWELLPLSFVVDWFYPIGPWLESRALLGSALAFNGFRTQKTIVKFSGVHAENGFSGKHPARCFNVSFSRTKNVPVNSLTNAKPQFRDWRKVFAGDAGICRLIDSIALLRQRVNF